MRRQQVAERRVKYEEALLCYVLLCVSETQTAFWLSSQYRNHLGNIKTALKNKLKCRANKIKTKTASVPNNTLLRSYMTAESQPVQHNTTTTQQHHGTDHGSPTDHGSVSDRNYRKKYRRRGGEGRSDRTGEYFFALFMFVYVYIYINKETSATSKTAYVRLLR